MRIYIPFNAPTVSSTLPDPILNDSLAPRNRIIKRPMMYGSNRTIVSTSDRLRLGVSFVLFPDKAAELREIVRAHKSDEWGIEFGSKTYKVFLMTNPVNFVTERKDRVTVTLELQGTEV